jgi:hypothetical protein
MKGLCWIVAFAALASVLPAHAQNRATTPTLAPPTSSTTDPVILIYRVTGVRDDGAAARAGTATALHCTNLSEVAETLQILVRDFTGSLVSNVSRTLNSAQTFTAVTHIAAVFAEDITMSPGSIIDQGYAAIGSTTTSIVCSAMLVNAAATSPVGISLHMVRYNPSPGTLE